MNRTSQRPPRRTIPSHGLPLRSLAYGAAVLVAVAVGSRVPGVGIVLSSLPAPVRLVLAPVAISSALTRVHIDGRNAHAAAAA